MTLTDPTPQRNWCQRCGMERDQVTTVTVTRDDGTTTYVTTLRLCARCEEALTDAPTHERHPAGADPWTTPAP